MNFDWPAPPITHVKTWVLHLFNQFVIISTTVVELSLNLTTHDSAKAIMLTLIAELVTLMAMFWVSQKILGKPYQ